MEKLIMALFLSLFAGGEIYAQTWVSLDGAKVGKSLTTEILESDVNIHKVKMTLHGFQGQMPSDGMWLVISSVILMHYEHEKSYIDDSGGRVYVNQQEYEALFETGHLNFIGDKNYIPYEKTTDGELVIYDYNMQVGDKYPHVEGHEDITVVSVENMMTQDGVSRRLLTLSNGYKLLEGIGCLNSPGLFFFYLNPILWEYYDKAWLSECGYGEYEDFPPESLLIYRADEMEAK